MAPHKAEPTNADLVVLIENQTDAFKLHAKDDHEVAAKQAKVNDKQEGVNQNLQSSLDALHEWKKTVATRDDVRSIFAEELRAFFTGSGKRSKAILVGTAIIVGSLGVIFGGLKGVLAWAAFTFLGK